MTNEDISHFYLTLIDFTAALNNYDLNTIKSLKDTINEYSNYPATKIATKEVVMSFRHSSLSSHPLNENFNSIFQYLIDNLNIFINKEIDRLYLELDIILKLDNSLNNLNKKVEWLKNKSLLIFNYINKDSEKDEQLTQYFTNIIKLCQVTNNYNFLQEIRQKIAEVI